jgi:hypothetical protein
MEHTVRTARWFGSPDAGTHRPASPKRASLRHEPVLLRFPAESDGAYLHPGIVVESDQDRCIILLHGPVPDGTDPRLEMYCLQHDRAPLVVGGVLLDVTGPRESPSLEVRLTGSVFKAEKRRAFRVCVAGLGMHALLTGLGRMLVVDTSVDGLGVLAARNSFNGKELDLLLEHGDKAIAGRVQVRNSVLRPDGKFRIGLEAAPADQALRGQLQQLTMRVQREQLRRLSARHAAASQQQADGRPLFSVVALNGIADEQATNPAADAAVANERRGHERAPWRTELLLELDDGKSTRCMRVTTADIGCTGFGFLCRSYVHVGTIIRAAVEIGSRQRPIVGVVRHCQVSTGVTHRVGVEFIRESQVSRARSVAQD